MATEETPQTPEAAPAPKKPRRWSNELQRYVDVEDGYVPPPAVQVTPVVKQKKERPVPPVIDTENPPEPHVAPDGINALSNPVPYETTSGRQDLFKGYQMVPSDAEVEIDGVVIKGASMTHVQALTIMTKRKRFFAANIVRAHYAYGDPYWNGYDPKKA